MSRGVVARLARVALMSVILGCSASHFMTAARNKTVGPGYMYGANATVRLIPIEGGCWVLDTPLGRYQPLTMPSTFQIDGLAVYAVVSTAPDYASICMVAPMVTLDTIRLR
jgi:hypothetical protein